MTEKKYIDASAWLEQCNKSYMHYNLARKIIAEAPAAPVFGQWIPAEQPPTEADEYIVMIAGATGSTVLHFDTDDEGKGVWFQEVEDNTNFYKVTHWMALPEGPRKEPERAKMPNAEFSEFAQQIDGGAVEKTPVTRRQASSFAKCRSCGAEIVFVMMKSGAKMPCDAALIRCREDKNAKTSFVLPSGLVMRGVETPDGVVDFMGYRSHFETCPEADRFRRKDQ